MKKLLLISPMLHQGGFEKVCVETARLLSPYYEVHILIFDSTDRFFDTEGLDVIDINVPSKSGKAGKIMNVLKRCRKVRAVKKRRGIDITYSFGSTANIVNVLSRCGDRIVTGIHGGIDLDNPTNMRLFFGRSDAVLCCSRGILGLARRRYASSFDVSRGVYVFNPIDTGRIARMAKEEPADFPAGKGRTLLTVGRDDPQKGYWHLIKAFSLLADKHPDLRLMIVGGGTFTQAKALCEALGISDRVRFTGLKENPYQYMKRADLYVLSSNHEGFPVAMAEAMAAGLPAVAADARTGPRELLLPDDQYDTLCAGDPDYTADHGPVRGIGGILFGMLSEEEDYDPASMPAEDERFAECIGSVLADEALRRKMAEEAAGRAASYGTEVYIKSLRGVLEGGTA